MGQSREHAGHRTGAMTAIIKAREHYDSRAERRGVQVWLTPEGKINTETTHQPGLTPMKVYAKDAVGNYTLQELGGSGS